MTKRGRYLQSEVMKILLERAEPLSAYEILDELRKSDAKIAPTTVYRTLDALTQKHSIRRLESLKAYVACQSEASDEASVVSICDDCGAVEENAAPDVLEGLASVLGKAGFSAQRHVIEVHGTCGACGEETASK